MYIISNKLIFIKILSPYISLQIILPQQELVISALSRLSAKLKHNRKNNKKGGRNA